MNIFRIFHLLVGIILFLFLVFDLFTTESVVDFLSYFTIQSNILTAIVFIFVGLSNNNVLKASSRLAISTFMIVTGVAYILLLEKTQGPLEYPFLNLLYHKIMPVLVVISLIIFPTKTILKYSHSLKWLIFPVIFGTYTLARGFITNWYPYDFINPIKIGYTSVLINFIIFGVILFILGVVLIFLNNLLNQFFKNKK